MPSDRAVISDQLRDLTKVVRLAKQHWQQAHPALPAASLGMLGFIQTMDGDVGHCHAKELAVRAGLDRSTVSRAVAALHERGLIERRADPVDGRASILVVTDAGREAIAESQRWFDDLMTRALGDWSAGDVLALRTCLGRFLASVESVLDTPHQVQEVAR